MKTNVCLGVAIAVAALDGFAAVTDVSPAGNDWPLVAMRQMGSTSQDAETMKKLLAIHAKYPNAYGETWLAAGFLPKKPLAARRAQALGDLAPSVRAAGMRHGFQQGVTLGHTSSKWPADGYAFSDDARLVDIDGHRTYYLCPTSPEVLAYEEWYAETYVRLGKLESFWLDDDMRLCNWKKRAVGCWCPRCLKMLNEKAGTNLTREEFVARIDAPTEDEPLRAVWAEFKQECLALFAAAARRGAKKANPAVRMGYQAVTSDEITNGFNHRQILAALSDNFRDTVGMRAGSSFYAECDARHDLQTKLIGVARECERCRAIPGWKGSVCYEQENWPHRAMEKSAEFCVKECALAFAVGCDGVAQYWYSSNYPEPLDHYEDYVRMTAAWHSYYARLAAISARTHLGGIAHKIDPKLFTSRANTITAAITNALARFAESDIVLSHMGVPVTVAESGTKSFYDPASVPTRHLTTAERAKLLDGFDALPGGPVCVRVEKVHPLFVYPRVDDRNRTVAVTFFNFSLGVATGVPVLIRRPAGAKATLVRPCAADKPLKFSAGKGDEIRFILPDLAPAAMCTVELGEHPVPAEGVSSTETEIPLEWNRFSEWFMYPPRFAFKPVPGASGYRFRVLDDRHLVHEFTAKDPTASLAPVWDKIPKGLTTVTCYALDDSSQPNAIVGERTFFRNAPFKEGSYPKSAMSYSAAADKALEYFLSLPSNKYFLEHGTPDPAYELNCYPTKMHAATASMLCEYVKTKGPRSAEARKLAVIAADYLLAKAQKPTDPLPYFTKTYEGDKLAAKSRNGQIMLCYPESGAMAFLDVWEMTGEEKYRAAALGIAATYLALQEKDGTWSLVMSAETGKVISKNRLHPHAVMALLERLYALTKDVKYREAADRAFAFIDNGPLKTWNWEGQFEDTSPSWKLYSNLSKHPACDTALYLMKRYPNDPKRLNQVRAILEFSEDQFIAWENPCRADGIGFRNRDDKPRYCKDCSGWKLPGVMEQYNWYCPIDASSAKLINTYLAYHRLTGDKLALAKARALGDSVVNNIYPEGRIPTMFCKTRHTYFWLNCHIATMRSLRNLASADLDR